VSDFPDGNYLQGREVVSASEHGGAAYLTFSDGITLEADLVIGADGVGSIVRRGQSQVMLLRRYTRDMRRGAVFTRRWTCPNSSAETLREALCILQYASVPHTWIPGCRPDGSLEAGRRRYNWVWYRTLSDADGSLARALN